MLLGAEVFRLSPYPLETSKAERTRGTERERRQMRWRDRERERKGTEEDISVKIKGRKLRNPGAIQRQANAGI